MPFSIKGALLDGCILAIISRDGTAYSYKLTQHIQEFAGISKSTLYPVLRKLQQDGCLESKESLIHGRNRRYYRITDKGKKKLTHIKGEWEKHKQMIDMLICL